MKFNTAIAQMMTLVNAFYDKGAVTMGEWNVFLRLMNPVAPHITEEMWTLAGFDKMVCENTWPGWDEAKTVEDMIEIAVQVNGKVRGKVTIAREANEAQAKAAAAENEAVQKALEGLHVIKEIYVQGKIYNIVAKSNS